MHISVVYVLNKCLTIWWTINNHSSVVDINYFFLLHSILFCSLISHIAILADKHETNLCMHWGNIAMKYKWVGYRHVVLTAVGGTVLVLSVSWLLFLLSSSLTGSLTLTPWYGLGLARADDGAREGNGEGGERERRLQRSNPFCYFEVIPLNQHNEFTGLARVNQVPTDIQSMNQWFIKWN